MVSNSNLQCMHLESKIIILFLFTNVKRFEHVFVKALYKYQYVCMYVSPMRTHYYEPLKDYSFSSNNR